MKYINPIISLVTLVLLGLHIFGTPLIGGDRGWNNSEFYVGDPTNASSAINLSYVKNNTSILIKRTTGINGLVSAQTAVTDAVPTGKILKVTSVITTILVSTDVSAAASVSLGTDGPAYASYAAAYSLVTTTTASMKESPQLNGSLAMVAGKTLYYNVTAGTGTTMTLAVDVFGYYVDAT